jgi:hypothetical protein
MILLTIVDPIIGHYGFKKIKNGQISKLTAYRLTIIGSLIPAITIVSSIPFLGMQFSDIGFKWVDLKASSLNNWIIIPTTILYILFICYNVYSIIVFKFKTESRAKIVAHLPSETKVFFPKTRQERRTWDFVAINAGITEEIIFRGYLFFILAYFFPNLPLSIILVLSTLIFGLGHIYQGFEVIKPAIVGLFYGFLFIVFNSIYPIIIIHILQDLVVRNLLQEDL